MSARHQVRRGLVASAIALVWPFVGHLTHYFADILNPPQFHKSKKLNEHAMSLVRVIKLAHSDSMLGGPANLADKAVVGPS